MRSFWGYLLSLILAKVNYAFINNEVQSETTSHHFNITKAANVLSVSKEDFIYGDAEPATAKSGKMGNGAETITYKGKEGTDTVYAESNLCPTKPGEYTVTYKVAADGNYEGGTATCDFRIEPRTIDIIQDGKETVAYDGNEHSLSAFVVIEDSFEPDLRSSLYNVELLVEGNILKNAGTSTATVTGFQITGNHPELEGCFRLSDNNRTHTLTITPIPAAFKWSDDEFTYDGTEHVPTAKVTWIYYQSDSTLGSGVEKVEDGIVVIVTGGKTNASSESYTATVTGFTGTNADNFVNPQDKTHNFTINPKEVSLSWSNTTFEYDGQEHVPIASLSEGSLITGDTCTVNVTGAAKTVGSDHTATVTGLSNPNYKLPQGENTQQFEITPRVIQIDWGDTEFTYDGNEHVPTAAVANIVTGDTCDLTVTGAQTDVGTNYPATVTACSNTSYFLPQKTAGAVGEEDPCATTFNIIKANQDPPQVNAVNETVSGLNDGKITGVGATMEYRAAGEQNYTGIAAGQTEITDLAPGTYYVRLRETDSYNPSADATAVIGTATSSP